MFGAAETAFQGGGSQSPLSVILTEGARAELAEGDGRTAARAALMPRAFPPS